MARCWIDHGAEFPELHSLSKHTETAQNFVVNPPVGLLTFMRQNGGKLKDEPGTSTFAVSTAEGVPQKMLWLDDRLNIGCAKPELKSDCAIFLPVIPIFDVWHTA